MTEPRDNAQQVSAEQEKAAETEDYIGTPVSDQELADVWTTQGDGSPAPASSGAELPDTDVSAQGAEPTD